MTSRSPTRRPKSAASAAKAARTRVRPAARPERSREEQAIQPERSREETAPVFRFKPGDGVRIREHIPSGHCRTPFYLRGKAGVVERCLGHFRNSEQLAYGQPGLPKVALYAVRFAQPGLWENYPGPRMDTLVAQLGDSWLDPA